jgi:hypothetical protein
MGVARKVGTAAMGRYRAPRAAKARWKAKRRQEENLELGLVVAGAEEGMEKSAAVREVRVTVAVKKGDEDGWSCRCGSLESREAPTAGRVS